MFVTGPPPESHLHSLPSSASRSRQETAASAQTSFGSCRGDDRPAGRGKAGPEAGSSSGSASVSDRDSMIAASASSSPRSPLRRGSLAAEAPGGTVGTGAAPGGDAHQRGVRRRTSHLKTLQEALQDCDIDAAVDAALRGVAPSCTPSNASLTKLISKYSKSGCWRRGVALFRHLHVLGVVADLPLSNAALWACSRGGDAAEACRIFQDMQKLPEKPDRISYRALFQVLAAQGVWASCVQAYIISWDDGVLLEGDACFRMLCMLRRAGFWQLAEACVLAELCKASRRGPFAALANAMDCTATSAPLDADATIARGLLQRLWIATQTRQPTQEEAPGAAVAGSWITSGTAGSGSVRTGGTDDPDACGLAEDALVTPCCNVLLQAYADATPPQPERALALLCAMSSAHRAAPHGPLKPDVVSFGLAALAHCRAGDVLRGLDVLTAYAHSGQPPPAAVYAQCIAAAASSGDDAAVADVWRHMHAHGVRPDDVCSTAFIRAAARSGHAGHCCGAVAIVLTLSSAAMRSPRVQRDVGTMLITLAQHGMPAIAVAAFQSILAAGVMVPAACVSECVRQLECRDALCCAGLRQTAAVAGFRHRVAHTYE